MLSRDIAGIVVAGGGIEEVIDEGATGFVVDGYEQAVAAIAAIVV